MRRSSAALLLAAVLTSAPASAGEGGDLIREALYAGGLQAGLDRLEPLLEAGDAQATFGIGLVHFVSAIEGFSRALYRHGFALPEGGGDIVPLTSVPVPANPNPEPLDYAKLRAILSELVGGLDVAAGFLEQAAGADDFVVHIDPLRIRIDLDGDGRADASESIASIFTQVFGAPQGAAAEPQPTRPTTPPQSRESPQRQDRVRRDERQNGATPDPGFEMPELTIGFDNADGYWLAGYSNVLAAQADFLLAHDFEDFANSTLHRLFPKAELPMQDYARGGMLMMDPESDTAIADVIAAIHTINWPVTEPERLRRVLERFRRVTALSRANWQAILAETDDDHELLPGPHQTTLGGERLVTEEVIAAWHETLDVADSILSGELLIPHWRFRQGFDLRAFFETSRRFDLVMLLTGYDALPYLKDGPIASAESFAAANRVFGNDLIGYVFWFN